MPTIYGLPNNSGNTQGNLKNEVLIVYKEDLLNGTVPPATAGVISENLSFLPGKGVHTIGTTPAKTSFSTAYEGDRGQLMAKTTIAFERVGIALADANYFDENINKDFIVLLKDCKQNIVWLFSDSCEMANFSKIEMKHAEGKANISGEITVAVAPVSYTGIIPTVVEDLTFTATFSPDNGVTNASVDGSVTIVFSKAVYFAPTNAEINNTQAAQVVQLRKSAIDGTLVSASVTYNSGTKTITIDPDAALDATTFYYVLVDTANIREITGKAPYCPAFIRFRTV